jgi:hypothetical protein
MVFQNNLGINANLQISANNLVELTKKLTEYQEAFPKTFVTLQSLIELS